MPLALTDDFYAERLGIGGRHQIQDLRDLLRPRVGTFRSATATNLNNATAGTISWDDATDRRTDPGITVDGASESVTVAGTPNFIELSFVVKAAIANNVNAQRPAPVIELLRSDGKSFGAAATYYIRDATDHEESSGTIHVIDSSPILDGSYSVTHRRDSTNGGVVSLDPVRSQFSIKVQY